MPSDRLDSKEDLFEVIDSFFDKYTQNMNTVFPVRVVNVNGQRLQVQPIIKGIEDVDGVITNYDLPVILDVPFFVLQGGGFMITVPVSIGDEGLLICCQRDIQKWKDLASDKTQTNIRRFSMNDGVYLGGISVAPIPSFDTDSLTITNGVLKFQLKGDKIETNAKMVVNNDLEVSGSITSGDITAGAITGDSVETSGGIDLDTHVHTGGTLPGGLTGPAQ